MLGILLPLWVVLMLLGSNLGLTNDQIADKYVYFATEDTMAVKPDGRQIDGQACRPEIIGRSLLCDVLPNNTAILYPRLYAEGAWYTPILIRWTLRHEVRSMDDLAERTSAGALLKREAQ